MFEVFGILFGVICAGQMAEDGCDLEGLIVIQSGT